MKPETKELMEDIGKEKADDLLRAALENGTDEQKENMIYCCRRVGLEILGNILFNDAMKKHDLGVDMASASLAALDDMKDELLAVVDDYRISFDSGETEIVGLRKEAAPPAGTLC